VRLVARLFDKDQVSTLASSVPQPYSSENPHAEVRTIVVSLSFTRSVTDKLFFAFDPESLPRSSDQCRTIRWG
jgi:hypothetical protein